MLVLVCSQGPRDSGVMETREWQGSKDGPNLAPRGHNDQEDISGGDRGQDDVRLATRMQLKDDCRETACSPSGSMMRTVNAMPVSIIVDRYLLSLKSASQQSQ